MIAWIGTPSGFSQSASIVGHCAAGAVKRAFGWAALAPVALAMSGVHTLPCQSVAIAGGSAVMPSHQTPASGVIQAMSSPTVVIFQPCFWKCGGGMSIAKFVLPQALGNAAAT